jgi:hypothetical protein
LPDAVEAAAKATRQRFRQRPPASNWKTAFSVELGDYVLDGEVEFTVAKLARGRKQETKDTR